MLSWVCILCEFIVNLEARPTTIPWSRPNREDVYKIVVPQCHSTPIEEPQVMSSTLVIDL